MEKGKHRGPADGNHLWALYHELGTAARHSFQVTVAATGYRWETFLRDSQPDRLLGDIPAGRLLAYDLFFPGAGLLVAALPAALRPQPVPVAADVAPTQLEIFKAAPVTEPT